MAEFTPRRGLEVPEGTDLRSTFGVGPVPIREAITTLDGTVDYLESVASLRPAADAVLAGTLHRATDTGVWMVSTGSAWVKVMAGSVVAGDIADGAVTTPKIADGAVDAGKITPGAVTTSRLADAAVTNAKIADGAVRTQHILSGAVTGAKIADGAITTPKLAVPQLALISIGVGWSPLGGWHVPAALKDVTGRVHLRGVLVPGSGATNVVGVLPEGFRPWANEAFETNRSVSVISETGVISSATSGGQLTLSGISYYTDI